MEFNVKLQELRKRKDITQEELAAALYVSRTAISKWDSGRGYPSIDSLKAIAKYFSVTIDELLASDEVLKIAEEDSKEKQMHIHDLVFGLLDCSNVILFAVPLFRQTSEGLIQAVSLLHLSGAAVYSKITYFIIVIGMILSGIMLLAFQNYHAPAWIRNKYRMSLCLNLIGILVFTISLQPYAAVVMLTFMIIKMLLTSKK